MNQTSASVVNELDKLERIPGFRRFYEIFKIITGDNNSEFIIAWGAWSDHVLPRETKRLVYYAPFYSVCERGSNENANDIIRRSIPKGATIGKIRNQGTLNLTGWEKIKTTVYISNC